jgi:NitT/TauT family transport system substrate-binding protein
MVHLALEREHGDNASAIVVARRRLKFAPKAEDRALVLGALLEKSGDLKIVHETITDDGTRRVFGGTMPAATLYARLAFIQANPNTIQALANAMVRTLKWLAAASTEDVLKAVPPEYLLGDRALYASAFERLRRTYSKDGRILRKGVENSYQVLLANNNAVRRAPVLFLEQTYTNVFVDKALAR